MIIQLANGKNGSTVYKDLASALFDLGFIYTIEILWLTLNEVVSLTGLIGNIFSVFIFFRPAFYSATSPPLFAYMRYEAMIGVVGNLVSIIYGFNICPDILPFVNNPISQWIQPYIMISSYNVTYYAKFLMEIAIVADRILMLAPSIGSKLGVGDLLKIKRPYLIFIGICAFSIFVDLPYFFLTNQLAEITFVNYGYPGYHVYTFYSNTKIAWSAWGNPGYFVMISIYILKNGVTFFVETALNVTSLILFKRHLAHKNRLMSGAAASRKQTKIEQAPHSSHQNRAASSIHPLAINLNIQNSTAAVDSSSSSTGGKKMAHLVLTMSITGFIHNVLLVTFTVYYSVIPKPSFTMRALQFTAYFASTLRHAINFVQFYFFNSAFRKETRIVLAKIKLVSTHARD
jgi:hypothetical protein